MNKHLLGQLKYVLFGFVVYTVIFITNTAAQYFLEPQSVTGEILAFSSFGLMAYLLGRGISRSKNVS